ncbi:MAG: hypothetical protein CBC34_020635 [Hyphomicrobiaceae bacterium TMED74]|nr:hypothetical protein [Filomicrobium sp.]RPG36054.1 MAG: hypothetical protein CBC34_020635 [Hyphomicrobiaceae bacterium TMED74]
MTTIALITIVGGIMIISGILGAVLAGIKNRDVSVWLAWTFLIPPTLLILLLLPRIKGTRPRRPTLDEEDTMSDHV